MLKQCSVANAQQDLPNLLEWATAGSDVLLTHRGKLVGVLLSVERYAALKVRPASFTTAYANFREKFPRGASGLGARALRALRSRNAGREVSL